MDNGEVVPYMCVYNTTDSIHYKIVPLLNYTNGTIVKVKNVQDGGKFGSISAYGNFTAAFPNGVDEIVLVCGLTVHNSNSEPQYLNKTVYCLRKNASTAGEFVSQMLLLLSSALYSHASHMFYRTKCDDSS